MRRAATDLVATAWTSAGNTSPMDNPATSPVPIAARVAAIAEAGFTGFGLIADDLLAIRDSIGFAALGDLATASGLTHIEIELLERWWIPRGRAGHSYDVRDLLFEAADVLSPAFIKIGSERCSRTTDLSELVAPLRALAEEAAAHGTRVAIEPMPFSMIDTIPVGAGLIRAAAHSAAGLLIDAWHVFRAGTTISDLAGSLTPEMIFGVELDDAAGEVVGTLFEDTVHNRLLCGDGDFDLKGLVTVLRHLEFRGPWGVEILSDSFRSLPAREALGLAAKSALTVL
ncbi:sugar phosphate isomerase/epimerase [Mycolicibacterium septicum DSM 44393]|uniref:Sugar phosphate isomerase/epimerase n=1 Tax=Mycolicibacterium septicum DSM 44393 TaxID=1341646 RepID=A0A7X6MTC3_9MYCO|nr:TIM barrel protein [Mycolicibacterium septicum]NKZ13653.1 sugar phosphate isomerase/epimerase [Mycolicibacterium septicum DSM 44393]